MEEILGLYNHIDVVLLIFARIMCSLIFLPLLTETKLPALAQSGLGMALTLIVFFSNTVEPLQYTAFLGFSILIIKECLIGIILSFGISIFFQVYNFMGDLLSMQGGLRMSTLFDPSTNTQSSTLGRFYYLGFSAIFLVSGGYHWFITAVVESFQIIPIALAKLDSANLLGIILLAISLFFEVSFKMAIPILAIMFLIDCGMGILARTVPQMNMFVIGIPLKAFILFLLLMLTVAIIPQFNGYVIKDMRDITFSLLEGMRP
jgi:flagellar biosynthetic protein FliR